MVVIFQEQEKRQNHEAFITVISKKRSRELLMYEKNSPYLGSTHNTDVFFVKYNYQLIFRAEACFLKLRGYFLIEAARHEPVTRW